MNRNVENISRYPFIAHPLSRIYFYFLCKILSFTRFFMIREAFNVRMTWCNMRKIRGKTRSVWGFSRKYIYVSFSFSSHSLFLTLFPFFTLFFCLSLLIYLYLSISGRNSQIQITFLQTYFKSSCVGYYK